MIKNLTKTQMEIEGLAKRVPKITKRQKEWAIRRYSYSFYHMRLLSECVCPNCHGKVPMEKTNDIHKQTQYLRCPVCGAKIETHRYFDERETRYWKNTLNHRENFFQVMSVVGDWQVTRLIYMQRWTYVRKESTPWEFYEVCQAWNNPKHAKTHFRSLPKQGMGYHYNPYSLHTWRYECTDTDNWTYNKYIEWDNELEARRPGGANYFNTDNLCPYGMKISAQFERMGLDATAIKTIKTLSSLGAMESLSGDNYKPMYETLLKGKDYEIYDHITENRNRASADAYCTAVKICKRNNFDYKSNVTEWLDLMNFVIKRGLDYHNPHYVCPSDIHEAHNHYIELERREEERREEARRRERIERMHAQTEKDMKNKEKAEKAFEKRRKPYFGLRIEGELFDIVVLKNIEEFRYEGTYLNHCVFRCGYYRKENSLILSARDSRNNPIETIEVDLGSYRINQCYGVNDTHSPLHNMIVKTMNDNMWRVKEIARGKVKVAC